MPTTTGLATSFITFSRPGASGGGATVTDRDGKIKWAGHNLLLASESFDSSSWSKLVGATVTANTVAAPNGTLTADTLNLTATANSRVEQTVSVLSGQPYTFTVWMRVASGTLSVRLYGLDAGTGSAFTVTTDWQQFSLTGTASAATRYPAIATDGTAGAVYAWGAHLYRSDLGGMQLNPAMPAGMQTYYPTTPRNLLGYSESFLTAWSSAGITSTLVDSGVVNPRSLNGSVRLLANASTGTHNLQQGPVTASTGVMTYSMYVKYSSIQWLALGMYDSGWRTHAFDIQNGVKGTAISAGLTGDIQSVGNGWYRISITRTASTSTVFFGIFLLPSDTTTTSWTTVGTEAAYIWGAQLSDSASLDTYVPQYGAAVTSAAYYAPRLDFDPVTLAAKGLLVEEARTNIATYSADFRDTTDAGETRPWVYSNVSLTANTTATTAPDGTTTADKLIGSSGSAVHMVYRNTDVAAASVLSCYAKAAELNFLILRVYLSTVSDYRQVSFNLSTGTVALTETGASGSIQAVGNGWYRCSVILPGATTGRQIQIAVSDTSSLTYTGNGTSGIYIWGAQAEAGSFSTSLIPTGSATATRAADVASVSTQAFPYSSTAGTYVANFQTLYSGAADISRWIVGGDASTSKRFIYIQNTFQTSSTDDGGTTVTATGDVTGSVSKSASTYDATGRTIVTNSGTVASGAVAVGYAATSSIDLASRGSNNALCGWLRQFTYIPRKVTDAELQSRTA